MAGTLGCCQKAQARTWADEMQSLATVLEAKGYRVRPASLTIERVPAEERDENGLPWYRIVVVENGNGEGQRHA